jgi:tetratricopeptide (TPR) repeat protein
MSTEIVDANRKAVAMLQNGNHDEALVSFRCALVGIRQSVTDANINDNTDPAELQDKGNLHTDYQFNAAQDPIHHQRGETSNLILAVPPGYSDSNEEWERVASPGNLFYVYNNAFDVGGSSHQEIEVATMLSPVVLFNIALTYHRKGLCDGTNSSKKLRKALQLYSMASSLLSSEDNVTDLYIIQLSVLNNTGQIHSHLFEENNAIQCRVRLHKALFEGPARSLLSMASCAFFVRSALRLEVSRDGFTFSPDA